MSHETRTHFRCDWCGATISNWCDSPPRRWITVNVSCEPRPNIRDHEYGELCSVECAEKWFASVERMLRAPEEVTK